MGAYRRCPHGCLSFRYVPTLSLRYVRTPSTPFLPYCHTLIPTPCETPLHLHRTPSRILGTPPDCSAALEPHPAGFTPTPHHTFLRSGNALAAPGHTRPTWHPSASLHYLLTFTPRPLARFLAADLSAASGTNHCASLYLAGSHFTPALHSAFSLLQTLALRPALNHRAYMYGLASVSSAVALGMVIYGVPVWTA